MTSATLGDVAEFVNGFAFKPEDWQGEGTPIIRIQNLTDPTRPYNRTTRDISEKYVVQPGDLLVSWSASLGVFTWDRDESGLVNQHIFKVVPKESKVTRSYLRHMLVGALVDMQRHLHGATMKHVNRAEFLATKIPLPTLDEQRRIAAILDQASALRAKRREATAQLSLLSHSIFHAMFGTNRWSATIGDIADVQIGPFGSLLHQDDYVGGGVAVINPMHIRNGKLAPDSRFSVTVEKASALPLYRIQEGDVVLGRRGEMGRAGVAKAEHTGLLCGTGSLILRPRRADPTFLHAVVTSSRMKAYLERNSLGATLPNLNAGIVRSSPVPDTPLDAQRLFASRIECVDAEVARVDRALAIEVELFGSLQTGAFSGDL